MRNRNNKINKSILKSIPTLVIIIAFGFVLIPPETFAFVSDSNVLVEKTGDDDFDKKFREGRDLIDKEEWAKAAEKFNEIITKYPDKKETDAALYWLALCYKKQKLFKETDVALDRLLKDFPASSWADDARVMKMEIAAPLGRWSVTAVGSTNSATLAPGAYIAAVPGTSVKGATTIAPIQGGFGSYAPYAELTETTSQTPLDREDEIRIAAFQSLLSADAKKGIVAMSGILKPDSKASETLKIEVLRAVRRPRYVNNYSSSQTLATTLTTSSVSGEFAPLLREALVKSFQNEPNVKIRKAMIYTLANLKDEQSVNYLAQLYASENDREVKKAIINGFGSSWGFSGFSVIGGSGNGLGQNSRTVVSGRAEKGVEFNKLLEIVRTENDAELRSLALYNLQRFSDWDANGEMIETLSKIYDSETNEDFKKTIIQSLGKIKQKQASKKLLDIAKNDKSDNLRLEAIYALRNTNTPEALEFLEELTK